MKFVSLEKSKNIKVGKSCSAREYPHGDKDIWGAVIKVNGRYPEKGVTVNLVCKELVYILNGNGKLVVNGKVTKVKKGDQMVIDKGEKFFWEGKLTMFMPCAPTWYAQQHKTII